MDYIVTENPLAAADSICRCCCVQMKSVGEVMAIGRTWQESVQKALRGMELSQYCLSLLLSPFAAEFFFIADEVCG
jgi:carbamoyl-phosphate synthase large subunit